MATLPGANVTISAQAGALAGGTGYCTVIGCVQSNADATPRVFSSPEALYTQHGYSPAVDYAALHMQDTGKPVLFVGIATATAGTMGSEDSTGVTGTCKISVAAGGSGYLEEVDAILTVTTGGTVGTDQIVFTLSLDGGRTEKSVRLGTATSYTIPYVGAVLSFTTGGTLVADDEYLFRTTAPMWDSTGLASARTALAAQLKLTRSWMVIGDIANSTVAGYVTTNVNAYETSNERFTYARVNVKDRLPLASKSKVKKRMMGSPQLTFAEVGATGDTITRDTGSWVTEGFAVGDLITVAGTASNNFTDAKITAVSATVLTLDTQDLAAEVISSGVTVVGSEELLFAEVGATGDTITRSTGSWTADGFAVGDIVTITGTASNNVTTTAIAALTSTVMTLGSTDLAAESIAGHRVTVTKVLTASSWISALDSGFASVTAQKRIDIAAGRLRKLSPLTGWEFRRPVSWAASIREYQHDVHITTWRKEHGPLLDWSMTDDDGNIAEYDERTIGGALAAGFTCARTWSNGPDGSFLAQSLTRDTAGSVLSMTHNMAVANVACTIIQTATENFIGKTPRKDAAGHLLAQERTMLEESVNTDLQVALMQEKVPGEGPRASFARWTCSADDDLSAAEGTITGVLDLRVNGTIVTVETSVKVS